MQRGEEPAVSVHVNPSHPSCHQRDLLTPDLQESYFVKLLTAFPMEDKLPPSLLLSVDTALPKISQPEFQVY